MLYESDMYICVIKSFPYTNNVPYLYAPSGW